MPNEVIAFEATKLILQFFGAAIIARLAVSWALKRYKSEKTWERLLTAYVDVIAALGQMRLVVGRWSDEVLERRFVSSDRDAAQKELYQNARRRLDEGVAIATLLLPDETAKLLEGLERALDNARQGQDQFQDLDSEYGVLDRALKAIVRRGRQSVGPKILL